MHKELILQSLLLESFAKKLYMNINANVKSGPFKEGKLVFSRRQFLPEFCRWKQLCQPETIGWHK
jgi:hypothetical protein